MLCSLSFLIKHTLFGINLLNSSTTLLLLTNKQTNMFLLIHPYDGARRCIKERGRGNIQLIKSQELRTVNPNRNIFARHIVKLKSIVSTLFRFEASLTPNLKILFHTVYIRGVPKRMFTIKMSVKSSIFQL